MYKYSTNTKVFLRLTQAEIKWDDDRQMQKGGECLVCIGDVLSITPAESGTLIRLPNSHVVTVTESVDQIFQAIQDFYNEG